MANAPVLDPNGPTVHAAVAEASTQRAKEGPSGVEELSVALPLTYTWDYATSRVELRTLYEKSKDLMWNARTELPWETRVDPEAENSPDAMIPLFGTPVWEKLDPKRDIPALRRNVTSYMFSNFLHGEQGALLAASQIVNCAPTSEAKLYAAAQVYDEARHVEAYDRYLREKLELIYPISPHLKKLLDMILADARWDLKYLGMQIMIEGVALGAFGLIQQVSQEPLIRKITQMIMQDESRHVAFGVLALRDTFVGMPASELRDREDFIIESSRLLRKPVPRRGGLERFGLPMEECREAAEKSEAMSIFRRLFVQQDRPQREEAGAPLAVRATRVRGARHPRVRTLGAQRDDRPSPRAERAGAPVRVAPSQQARRSRRASRPRRKRGAPEPPSRPGASPRAERAGDPAADPRRRGSSSSPRKGSTARASGTSRAAGSRR